jgi:hypothetical protein
METTLDLTADIIDIRDIIERIEELRDEREQSDIPANEYGGPADTWADERAELAALEGILSELAGCGGDEQWQGDWYPVTLISDSYFVDAMRELVQDIGDLPRDIPAYLAIDWEATANNLRADYSCVDIGELTYWYR